MRRAFLGLFVLAGAACGTRASAPRPAPPASPSARVAPSAPAPVDSPYLEWAELPGCTRADAAAVKTLLAGLRAIALEGKPDAPVAPARAIIDEAWASPCLAHVTRFFSKPDFVTVRELRALWFEGLPVLGAMSGGLYVRDGQRFVWLPPATASTAALDADAVHALDPIACTTKTCGLALTFEARAEKAFDAFEGRGHAWRALHGSRCKYASEGEPRRPSATPFESWMLCELDDAPRSYRYVKTPRLRAPERGFLILRGRRGHYEFSDEIRAYDLATGAAYVARSGSTLVLGELGSVDSKAVDSKRKPEAFTGNVSAEAVRELAFLALSKSAVVPMRTQMQLVPVPADVKVALSARSSSFASPMEMPKWWSSAQTTLSFVIVEDERIVHEGSFAYPYSASAAEQQADEVLEVLEAGLERGCPRAKLPKRIGKSAQSGAHAIDADPADAVKLSQELERALDGLRKTCP